ncbi:MAG TPA: hypothetical protein VFK22_03030 [Candidatus Dormibacteraeota bacterium]|nr:hypothetical protein [Candidatus Dormibacteraeota bacterium]
MTNQRRRAPDGVEPPPLASAARAASAKEVANRLSRVEALYAKGRFEEALALGESILDRDPPAKIRGKLRHVIAMAALQLGRMERGEELLEQARPEIVAAGDVLTIVELMTTEAIMAEMRQRPEAVALAEQSLAACRRLEPVPRSLEVRALNAVAAAKLAAGDWRGAVDAYEVAIERTASLYDMSRQARLLTNVSIAYRELGQPHRSLVYATRSVELLETLRDFVSLARSENNLALSCMACDDFASARRHLMRSLELCEQTNLELGRSHVLLSLCELNVAEARYVEAFKFAKRALVSAESQGERSSIAHAHMWLGRVASSLDQPDVADSEFEAALRQLTHAGDNAELVRCHAWYADALERRGDLQRAYEHVKGAVAHATRTRTKPDSRGIL